MARPAAAGRAAMPATCTSNAGVTTSPTSSCPSSSRSKAPPRAACMAVQVPQADRRRQGKPGGDVARAAAGGPARARSLPVESGRNHRPSPSGRGPPARGRPGVHPLRELIGDYLALPRAELSARPGGLQVRDLDPERFTVSPLPRARVLLIDDTWTTGSSAQSAAIALR